MDFTALVLQPFLLTFFVSLLATPLTIRLFKRFGWVIDPKKSPHPAHVHTKPVPKGGGVPIFLAIVVAICLLLKIDKHLVAIGAAMIVTLVVGVVDDIRGLPPLVRLLFNFLAAILVVSGGIGIAYISNPLGGTIDLSLPRIYLNFFDSGHQIWILADLFALIWIPFMMNAINRSSGVDGQASGMIAVAAVVIGILSLNFSADITQWPVAILAFSLAGAFAALTVFHFYPQKIMPGYSATTLAGLLLAVLSILSTTKVGTAIMVLGLPLIDATYTIVRRLIRGKSPFSGDRGHLHHKLLSLGWGKRRIALFYWCITAILGVLALFFNAKMKLFAIVGVAVMLVGFFLWIYFGISSRRLDHDSG